MNKPLVPLLAVLSLAAGLSAQAPNPKTPHHEHLTQFVGSWQTETTMRAVPGVPGMEKAVELVGTERAELVCQGLWLKVSSHATGGGESSSGLWLLGYDPFAKKYQCIVVPGPDGSACDIDGRYDKEKKAWMFEGETPAGRFRGELEFDGADRSTETCYIKDSSGNEVEFMRVVRTRMKKPVRDASAEKASADSKVTMAELPPALAALRADCGDWKADFKMKMPNSPAIDATCHETVVPVCDGLWTWSDFDSRMMGAPFEGHALTGYDTNTKKVVSYWIDSMECSCMRTEGTFDPETKVFHMTGSGYTPDGESMPVTSMQKPTGKNSRQLRMQFGKGDEASVMTIDYRRPAEK